jgi:hypothetical protein
MGKNVILRNFEVLNRRFTEDEKEQFLFNIHLLTKGPKKYVYNPYLFSSEKDYAEYYARMNSGKAYLSKDSKQEIAHENEEKAQKHEHIVFEKPNYSRDITFTDRSLGIKRLQLIKREYLI